VKADRGRWSFTGWGVLERHSWPLILSKNIGIDAQSPETVRSSFERCARKLGLKVDEAAALSGEGLRELPPVQGVLNWLADRDEFDTEWLVVIDNADDTEWDVEEIVPQGPRGNIIVTSQHSQPPRFLNKHCARTEVGVMEPVEARALLLKHVQDSGEPESSEVAALIDQVVGRLERLALAVDLAGAYVAEGMESANGYHTIDDALIVVLRQYLVDYDRHQDDLLKHPSFYKLSSYNKTVWTVWDKSLATIETKYPKLHVNHLLTLLAYFDRGNIQDELFRLASVGFQVTKETLRLSDTQIPEWLEQFLTSDGQEWDDFHYRKAVEQLMRYGLLQRVEAAKEGTWRGVTMHSLVQWQAKCQMGTRAWRLWPFVFLTAAAYQINQEKSRPQFRRYLPTHLAAISTSDYSLSQVCEDLNDEGLFELLSWHVIAEVYHNEGRWKEAEELFVQVVETSLRVLGQEHPDTLASMNNLASTYWNQGRLKEAEELEVQVMETRKRVLGQEHPSTLTSMANLASTYWNQGRLKEAEELNVQVMETMKRVLGQEHPDTLASMGNLALTYKNQGRWKEAEYR
jgi:tetratricopeptide (TPR) repeat protein